jgi:hypothetical protein
MPISIDKKCPSCGASIKDYVVTYSTKQEEVKVTKVSAYNQTEAINKVKGSEGIYKETINVAEYSTGLIHGQKVRAKGKDGIVVDISDKIKVKFGDGNFGFFTEEEVEPLLVNTRLKSFKFTKENEDKPSITSEDLTIDKECKNCPYIKSCYSEKRSQSERWDSCVRQVRARGGVESPEAVCTERVGHPHPKSLKNTTCPFCMSLQVGEIKMNNDNTKYSGATIYGCFKCGGRFSVE